YSQSAHWSAASPGSPRLSIIAAPGLQTTKFRNSTVAETLAIAEIPVAGMVKDMWDLQAEQRKADRARAPRNGMVTVPANRGSCEAAARLAARVSPPQRSTSSDGQPPHTLLLYLQHRSYPALRMALHTPAGSVAPGGRGSSART